MVPLKQAVLNAIEFAIGLLGDRARDVQLEEVESTEINRADVWLITLSMIRQGPLDIRIPGYNAEPRDYKTFTVRKDTGAVIAMKIREMSRDAAALLKEPSTYQRKTAPHRPIPFGRVST